VKVKPVVLDQFGSGQLQQLRSGDDLDVPLVQRVELLEEQLASLVSYLAQTGFELPDDLLNAMKG
jgi:hypothetical protein